MAITKTLTIKGTINKVINGWNAGQEEVEVSVPDAYIKVASVAGDKNSVVAHVIIVSGDYLSHRNESFVPNLDGPNFIKQAYEHLKTLPEFANATDC
jgi:hypothetical protein